MSAYVIDREHVEYLVDMAYRYCPSTANHLAPTHDELGQKIWDECLQSVKYRYPDDDRDQLPGPVDESFEYSHPAFGPSIPVDHLQVIQSCWCYAYQSCEHPGWKDSDVKRLIDHIESEAIRRLEGFEDKKWGAPDCMYPEKVSA